MRLDLDAARAARREAGHEAPVVVLDGQEYSLPVEIPYAVVDALADLSTAKDLELPRSLARVCRGFLGESQYEAFMATRPSISDLNEFVDNVGGLYGFAKVEPEAESEAESGSPPGS